MINEDVRCEESSFKAFGEFGGCCELVAIRKFRMMEKLDGGLFECEELGEIRTADGRPVERISKGKYSLRCLDGTIELTAYSPKAP